MSENNEDRRGSGENEDELPMPTIVTPEMIEMRKKALDFLGMEEDPAAQWPGIPRHVRLEALAAEVDASPPARPLVVTVSRRMTIA